MATRFHGFNRATDDMDMWVDDNLLNRQNLRRAFQALGYGDFASFETMQFVPGWTSFNAAGIELDIMTDMPGLEGISFQSAYEMMLWVMLDGVKVSFLHINHLIANKKAVNQPKDQLDVIQLEKIKKIRDGVAAKQA
jgi:hypothetical protein